MSRWRELNRERERGVMDRSHRKERGCLRALSSDRTEQSAASIDRPVQVVPATGNLHVRLVDARRATGLTATLCPELSAYQRREAEFLGADCLVRDVVAALQEQLGNVPQPELVAQAPQDGEEHDVGRVLQLVERCTRPFVEAAMAAGARESAVAERRPLLPPTHRCRFASADRSSARSSSQTEKATRRPDSEC